MNIWIESVARNILSKNPNENAWNNNKTKNYYIITRICATKIDKPNLEKEEEDKDKKAIKIDNSKDECSSNSINSVNDKDYKISRRTKHIKIKRIKKDANKQNIYKKLNESNKDKLKEEDNKNGKKSSMNKLDKDKDKDTRTSVESKKHFKDRLSLEKKDKDVVKPSEPAKR